MSDIKFDGLENLRAILNPTKPVSAKEPPANETSEKEGIEVNLSSFADMAIAEASATESARVLEMKQRIEMNHYQINTDVLAQKLLPHLFKTIG